MTKIIRTLLAVGMLSIFAFHGAAAADTSGRKAVLVDEKFSDLDVENAALLQALTACKEVRQQQEIKARLMQKVIRQADNLNRKIEELNAQISEMKKDNEKLVRYNTRVESQSEEAAKSAREDLNQKERLLIEARLEKEALTKVIQGLENERSTLQIQNQRLSRLNADLEGRRQAEIRRAEKAVSAKIEAFIRRYPRRINVPKVVKDLGAENTALKKENERLLKFNAKLEATGKELFLKANAVDYRAKGYDSLSKAMQKLNHEVVQLKKENGELKDSLKTIKEGLDKERASMYREVAASAAQAGLLDEAINAYTVSLKLDPDDPMTHYYLGLLYSKQWKDADAIVHFRRYLALVPMAANRAEVEYFMSIVLDRSGVRIK